MTWPLSPSMPQPPKAQALSNAVLQNPKTAKLQQMHARTYLGNDSIDFNFLVEARYAYYKAQPRLYSASAKQQKHVLRMLNKT